MSWGDMVMKKQSTLDLEFMALLSEVMFGHGFAHYGYFEGGKAPDLTGQSLSNAQQAYFDKLAGAIPDGVKTIFEIGSGTGANALALIDRGYDMTLLSPSVQMNQMAREKLPAGTEVIDATLEEFERDVMFDICLYAESFHYIDMTSALAKTERHAREGFVLFDYFRREAHRETDRTHSTHAEFLAALEAQGAFEVVSDEDVTAEIAPTFEIMNYVQTEKLAPFLERFRGELAREKPWRAWVLEKFAGKKLNRLAKPSKRPGFFEEQNEYHLMVMKRRN